MVILEFLAGIVGIALIALYAIGEFLALIIGLAHTRSAPRVKSCMESINRLQRFASFIPSSESPSSVPLPRNLLCTLPGVFPCLIR